jgi:hypothetical protein
MAKNCSILSQKVPKIELYKHNEYSSNFGTFWLKIEKIWPFEEISIFSNGGHLAYGTVLTDTILKGDHPRIISAEMATITKNRNFFKWPKTALF